MQRMRSKEIALVAAGAAASWAWFGIRAETPIRADGASGAGDAVVVTPLGPGEGESIVVLDGARKTFAVYHHDARKGKLRLAAVRRYAADQQLAEYNNEAPTVGEIERLIKTR
jgi:hypothetical protein